MIGIVALNIKPYKEVEPIFLSALTKILWQCDNNKIEFE